MEYLFDELMYRHNLSSDVANKLSSYIESRYKTAHSDEDESEYLELVNTAIAKGITSFNPNKGIMYSYLRQGIRLHLSNHYKRDKPQVIDMEEGYFYTPEELPEFKVDLSGLSDAEVMVAYHVSQGIATEQETQLFTDIASSLRNSNGFEESIR